jgi:hypothetical protein
LISALDARSVDDAATADDFSTTADDVRDDPAAAVVGASPPLE